MVLRGAQHHLLCHKEIINVTFSLGMVCGSRTRTAARMCSMSHLCDRHEGGRLHRTSNPSGPPPPSTSLAERACIASYISLGWLHSFFSAAHAVYSRLSASSLKVSSCLPPRLGARLYAGEGR